MESTRIDLSLYDNRRYSPGRGRLIRGLWYLVSLALFESGWFPLGWPKRWLLRRFGARIGRGLVLKPGVWIKYPWRLAVGDHCWIGKGVWIDNLADVRLGSHVCLSQQAYICTGSHDYRKETFDLITRPVEVGNGAWLGARTLVLGGVSIGANAVVAAGGVVVKDVAAATVVGGNPARPLGEARAELDLISQEQFTFLKDPMSPSVQPEGGAVHVETRKCTFCGKQTDRRKCHKNRYGEYACRSCRKKGKRWSRRRVVWEAAWKQRYVAMFVCLGAAGIVVFYQIVMFLLG